MMSSNNSLKASDLRDRLQTLASREGIRRWDLGAACSDDCSVQVDRGEAKHSRHRSGAPSPSGFGTAMAW